MSRYTPNTDKVLEAYTAHGHLIDDERYRARGLSILQDEIYREEFDRWLEQHDREVAAKALHLAADRLPAFHDRNAPEWAITSTFKWLHERADRIESGDSDE